MAKPSYFGGSSAIYHLNPLIVVKVPRSKSDEEDHENEQANFDIIECHERHPNLVISYHRVQRATFLEFAGTNLECIIQNHQTREPDTRRVLFASTAYPLHWRAEISGACAWLEEIGLAHCDLRTENIVIDNNHAKVIDFDRSVQAGLPLDVGTEPFARKLDNGSYGIAGPVTEQFAIGSLLYCLTRGHKPYEDEWFGKDHWIHIVKMFRNRQFPQLESNPWDTIINSCWAGKFETVDRLYNDIEPLVGNFGSTPLIDQTTFEKRKAECEQAVKEGLISKLVQNSA